MGYKGAGVLAHMLGRVMFYCQQEQLPPLTVVVVNQETGLPGSGLLGAELNADRERVFGYNWYGIVPPSPTELDAAYQRLVGTRPLDTDSEVSVPGAAPQDP